jgi:hypothetical protein
MCRERVLAGRPDADQAVASIIGCWLFQRCLELWSGSSVEFERVVRLINSQIEGETFCVRPEQKRLGRIGGGEPQAKFK